MNQYIHQILDHHIIPNTFHFRIEPFESFPNPILNCKGGPQGKEEGQDIQPKTSGNSAITLNTLNTTSVVLLVEESRSKREPECIS